MDAPASFHEMRALRTRAIVILAALCLLTTGAVALLIAASRQLGSDHVASQEQQVIPDEGPVVAGSAPDQTNAATTIALPTPSSAENPPPAIPPVTTQAAPHHRQAPRTSELRPLRSSDAGAQPGPQNGQPPTASSRAPEPLLTTDDSAPSSEPDPTTPGPPTSEVPGLLASTPAGATAEASIEPTDSLTGTDEYGLVESDLTY